MQGENASTMERLRSLTPGAHLGPTPWLEITQDGIDAFGAATRDPDPMHVLPDWAREHSPFKTPIAFGFQTIGILTFLLREAWKGNAFADAAEGEVFLNYGFNRLRLVEPVRVGDRIRGVFQVASKHHRRGDIDVVTLDARVEIDGRARPALVADWLIAALRST
jgi:acyl dehydratase